MYVTPLVCIGTSYIRALSSRAVDDLTQHHILTLPNLVLLWNLSVGHPSSVLQCSMHVHVHVYTSALSCFEDHVHVLQAV